MSGTTDLDLLARVRTLEQRVRDLSRVRSLPPPNLRDLRDANLSQVVGGQGIVYNPATGRWDPQVAVRARVTGTGTQTFISNTPATVALNSVTENVGGGLTWDATNSRWVCVTPGSYLCRGRDFWAQNNTGTRSLHLIQNAATTAIILDDDHVQGNAQIGGISTPIVKSGRVAAPFAAVASVSGTVSFPGLAMPLVPSVTLTMSTSVAFVACIVTGLTGATTGFTWSASEVNGAAFTDANAILNWIACCQQVTDEWYLTNSVEAVVALAVGDTISLNAFATLVSATGAASTTIPLTMSLPDSWLSMWRLGPL